MSRYDLPNFVVNTKSDRPFYLPGQNAEVVVGGDYLFGQPVKRGRVRVVREEERTWNYKEQKYETTEGAEYKGEADEQGRFTARMDLKDYHDELKYNEYRRFRDVTFAAYFTDLTTRRTEQRRFDLRVTKEPLHVYFIKPNYHVPKKLPLEFYLSASYADGARCAGCSIAIRETDDEGKPAEDKPRGPVRTVKTNAFGVVKVSDLQLSEASQAQSYPHLIFEARDAQGRAGRLTDDFYWDDDEALRLSAERTLYRAGEPFAVKIRASVPAVTVFVDVTSQTDAGGRARVKFKFADNITTWKMSVIGSTVDGRMGVAEAELPAFQPFFAEHDPPRVLTEGDEIALPVVVRNYLDKPQSVSVSMKPESWFSLLGAAGQRAEVRANDAARVTFPFRAVASVGRGAGVGKFISQLLLALGRRAGKPAARGGASLASGRELRQDDGACERPNNLHGAGRTHRFQRLRDAFGRNRPATGRGR